jgi:gliding motility-associated lipoprotein GldD
MRTSTGFIIILLAFAACRPHAFTPKPPGYYRVDTPATHQYRLFDMPGYPYTFEYPVYATVQPDTEFLAEHADNPYWININFPGLGGVLNLTYKQINAKQSLLFLEQKAYELSFFHHDKADYIDQTVFRNPAGITGVIYGIGGDAASKYQFTATDSIHHFLRGALYFDVTPNADSLKPSYDFLEKDVEHMLYTLKWR